MSCSYLVDQWTDERINNYLKGFCFYMQVWWLFFSFQCQRSWQGQGWWQAEVNMQHIEAPQRSRGLCLHHIWINSHYKTDIFYWCPVLVLLFCLRHTSILQSSINCIIHFIPATLKESNCLQSVLVTLSYILIHYYYYTILYYTIVNYYSSVIHRNHRQVQPI